MDIDRFKTLPSLQFITHETATFTEAERRGRTCSDYAEANKKSDEIQTCSLVESAEKALSCGVKWVQFRCKTPQSAAWMREQALCVQQLCKQHHALFVVDDDVELAREIEADGVHVGKNDMPVEQARRILGARFLIGGTANTLQDMVRIQAQGGDYIGLGPFRFTRTKEKLSPVLGVEGYERLMREARQAGITLPVHAIGGITGQDAPALKQAGVQGIAVSSALLQSPAPQEEVAHLLQPFLSL